MLGQNGLNSVHVIENRWVCNQWAWWEMEFKIKSTWCVCVWRPLVVSQETDRDTKFFDIISYVFVSTRARSVKFGVQVLWGTWTPNHSLHGPCAHRTPCVGAELGSFTSFSVCMFKLRFVFVCSGIGGCKGELGSVFLSVRHGSLRVHQTLRVCTQLSFCASCVWML